MSANGWQPIETAPKDGPVILYPLYVPARWDIGAQDWLVMQIPLTRDLRISSFADFGAGDPFYELTYRGFFEREPTHWRPLPEPPE